VLQYFRKKVLRGALTNGQNWIFLLVQLNDDYDGASYKQSSKVKLTNYGGLGWKPDLIAGILAYWVS